MALCRCAACLCDWMARIIVSKRQTPRGPRMAQIVFGRGIVYSLEMKSPPLVLVSPSIERKGEEFGDLSTSLSETYQQALMRAGCLPLGLPATVSCDAIAECVSRCDGVLLTGGEDVNPAIYGEKLPTRLRRKEIGR